MVRCKKESKALKGRQFIKPMPINAGRSTITPNDIVMRRIANYRSGDRAEALGIVLMQLFCAVAPVPRQEDFGIFDAVATLLRRDGIFLYAEDSFLIQFKSRTEKVIEYIGDKFQSLINQDLPLFIAHIDLVNSELNLYGVCVALTHPNINDVKGLILRLGETRENIITDTLTISLQKPILRWNASDLANKEFEVNAYETLHKWLEIDRWNRRYRKMGVQRTIHWETNTIPIEGMTTTLWGPDKAKVACNEMTPVIRFIGSHTFRFPELVEPFTKIVNWMREQGVDPDPDSILCQSAFFNLNINKARKLLETNQNADIALIVDYYYTNSDKCSITLTIYEKSGNGTVKLYLNKSIEELSLEGLEIEFVDNTQSNIRFGLGEIWLRKHRCKLLTEMEGVFLLVKTAIT